MSDSIQRSFWTAGVRSYCIRNVLRRNSHLFVPQKFSSSPRFLFVVLFFLLFFYRHSEIESVCKDRSCFCLKKKVFFFLYFASYCVQKNYSLLTRTKSYVAIFTCALRQKIENDKKIKKL